MEETVARMVDLASIEDFTITVQKKFGSVYLKIVGEASEFCIKLITMIAEFVPLILFLSMAGLVLSTGAESIILLGKLVIGVFFGHLILKTRPAMKSQGEI